jgi:hypothetical protein
MNNYDDERQFNTQAKFLKILGNTFRRGRWAYVEFRDSRTGKMDHMMFDIYNYFELHRDHVKVWSTDAKQGSPSGRFRYKDIYSIETYKEEN